MSVSPMGSSSILWLIFVLLVLSFRGSLSSLLRGRSILRTIEDSDPPDFAVDLKNTNFESVLRRSPASFAIVEFFAHWCPACRNYKPHYEKVARLFNGPDAVHPGIIFMARVDCALKVNTKLCDKFSVGHYPMLLWGSPSKFASSGGWEPKQDKSEIYAIDDGRTAERLLNWINKKIGSAYGLDDKKYENEHLTLNASDPGQISRAIYDVEEATSNAFDIIFKHKINAETKAPFIKFLQLLVAHHPSKRCRKGGAEILVNFDDLLPSDLWSASKQETVISNGRNPLTNFRVCGKEVPRGYWIFCRGSKNETRAFSCGLWVLLHSLSVRIEDGESQTVFTTVCDFIHKFFICEECQQHFYKMCSSVSAPFVKTRDFALWLWNAHNKVNERLMKEEASLKTGDPKFPKMLWPPKQLCPSCYRSQSWNNNGTISVDWNNDQVFKFLVDYYGQMLVSSSKGKGSFEDDESESVDDTVTSANVVAVPIGAALGIALASCAFGALACFWRSQQKNRKYFHAHSLKNI